MFTGIIEGVGKVVSVTPHGGGARITVETSLDLSTSKLGDSIAVEGCCLTATEISAHRFSAMMSKETLDRTTLGRAAPGRRVNLERALKAGDRLDGHIVQGHVDGVGRIGRTEPIGESTRWYFECASELMPFLVEKGSITVDGISLTVNGVSESGFHVAIIPHTAEITSLADKRAGDHVNLETDVVGKYIVSLARRQGLAETPDARMLRKLQDAGLA